MRSILILGLSLAMVAIPACGDDDSGAADDGRIDVVASFYPLAWVSEHVGGDAVRVRDLTPPGAEPHDFELGPDDVDHIQDADLVVVLGKGFQPAVEKAADGRDGTTLVVADALELTGDDPHVWLDPVQMGAVVAAVIEALVGVDPAHANGYRDRGAEVSEQLGLLDEDLAMGLAECARHDIVTAHEAFGWLADRYGLTQEAIAGISPEQEPDPKRLAELTDLVKAKGVTTIFTEELVSPKVAKTLARETGARTEVLSPLESKPGSGDYLSVMREDLAKLRKALDCK
jgi:zinc transport system substrate-binding protein